jgi:hypothetical protein
MAKSHRIYYVSGKSDTSSNLSSEGSTHLLTEPYQADVNATPLDGCPIYTGIWPFSNFGPTRGTVLRKRPGPFWGLLLQASQSNGRVKSPIVRENSVMPPNSRVFTLRICAIAI